MDAKHDKVYLHGTVATFLQTWSEFTAISLDSVNVPLMSDRIFSASCLSTKSDPSSSSELPNSSNSCSTMMNRDGRASIVCCMAAWSPE